MSENVWSWFACTIQHSVPSSQRFNQKCSLCPFINQPIHTSLFICPSFFSLNTALHLCRSTHFSLQASLLTTESGGVTPCTSGTSHCQCWLSMRGRREFFRPNDHHRSKGGLVCTSGNWICTSGNWICTGWKRWKCKCLNHKASVCYKF